MFVGIEGDERPLAELCVTCAPLGAVWWQSSCTKLAAARGHARCGALPGSPPDTHPKES